MMNTTELIALQSANANQNTGNGIKSSWKIKENVTGDVLCEFPAIVSDQLMFQILDFARKHELIALNEGIKFQKNKQNKAFANDIEHLKTINKQLAEENERLANILEQHIKNN